MEGVVSVLVCWRGGCWCVGEGIDGPGVWTRRVLCGRGCRGSCVEEGVEGHVWEMV